MTFIGPLDLGQRKEYFVEYVRRRFGIADR
jgi:hypothetical protein